MPTRGRPEPLPMSRAFGACVVAALACGRSGLLEPLSDSAGSGGAGSGGAGSGGAGSGGTARPVAGADSVATGGVSGSGGQSGRGGDASGRGGGGRPPDAGLGGQVGSGAGFAGGNGAHSGNDAGADPIVSPNVGCSVPVDSIVPRSRWLVFRSRVVDSAAVTAFAVWVGPDGL